jgi:hypothetical protein
MCLKAGVRVMLAIGAVDTSTAFTGTSTTWRTDDVRRQPVLK